MHTYMYDRVRVLAYACLIHLYFHCYPFKPFIELLIRSIIFKSFSWLSNNFLSVLHLMIHACWNLVMWIIRIFGYLTTSKKKILYKLSLTELYWKLSLTITEEMTNLKQFWMYKEIDFIKYPKYFVWTSSLVIRVTMEKETCV